ncbi:hypothetical protein CB0940_11205 [Cercospora beticola]|uniref:Uncharacterized protein n=1 Tax=Cercospora beticola TaxID=122368 RepID=A0A2G5HF23_CERBT|nr:hypothetical protein CB0940_11205 [Cercospora beticola]PIA90832.1 hypothetical protein CB0940_11205 [Cercospora beticola]WPB08038.1 hypothetical protein RHO25_012702 [Cercospora beticola]
MNYESLARCDLTGKLILNDQPASRLERGAAAPPPAKASPYSLDERNDMDWYFSGYEYEREQPQQQQQQQPQRQYVQQQQQQYQYRPASHARTISSNESPRIPYIYRDSSGFYHTGGIDSRSQTPFEAPRPVSPPPPAYSESPGLWPPYRGPFNNNLNQTRPRTPLDRPDSSGSHRGLLRDFFGRSSSERSRVPEATSPKYRDDDWLMSVKSQYERQFRRSKEEEDDCPPTPPPKDLRPTPAERAAKLRRDRERALQKEKETSRQDFAPRHPPPPPPPKSQTKAKTHTTTKDADASQGRQRCFGCPYAAPVESLRQGLCEVCYQRRLEDLQDDDDHREEAEEDDVSHSSSRSSSPSRPRKVNDERYMKISGSHTMRRVRRTWYHDPGNPFAFVDEDNEADGLLPTTSYGSSPAKTESSGFNLELRGHFNRSAAATDSSGFNFELENIAKQSSTPHSHFADEDVIHEEMVRRQSSPDVGMERFGDSLGLPLHAPKAQRTGTPALVRCHSLKEAASFASSTPPPEEVEYIPPRTFWKKSAASKDVREATIRVGDATVTNHYGWYDGILQEYHTDPEEAILDDHIVNNNRHVT